MMRRQWSYLLGCFFLACTTALVILPARWAIAMLPQSWPLAVVDASGTIWSGSAIIGVGTPERRRSLPEPVLWNISFSGGPSLALNHPWLGGPLTLRMGWMSLHVSGQTLQLPASALGALDARIEAIGPGGELSIKWPASIIGFASQPIDTLLLQANWRNAASSLTPIRPLGSYALSLKQAEQNRINLLISTQQGPLMLDGVGVIDSNKRLQFDGIAQVDPTANDDVRAALRDVLTALGPHKNNQTVLQSR